jgi:hypothetical protein
MTRRRVGQLAATGLALALFGLAAWEAQRSSIPAIRVYDGFWIILGVVVAWALTAPLAWRWPRERSLPMIVCAAVIGCLVPLVISAVRHHMPLAARLRGAWIIGGADVVAPAMILGSMCLWFALREHGSERRVPRSDR